MTTFLTSFDPRQIRYVGKEYLTIVEHVAAYARRSQQPELALIPIAEAILRLDPTSSILTSAHIILAKTALESQLPSLARPVVDQPILYFPDEASIKNVYLCSSELAPYQFITAASGLTDRLNYQDVLGYFLVIATIYIALHDWERASEALECAIVYPVKDNVCSKITLEAYKKWIIVHVIYTGRAGRAPSTISGHVTKQLQLIAKPYQVVANLYESASASRLKDEVAAGSQYWINDNNMGLMHLLLSSYQKSQIRNLANVYRTVSITEVTRLTTSAETGESLPHDQATEALIRNLISTGTLHATLHTGSPSILTFASSEPILSEEEVKSQLSASMVRLKTMVKEIRTTDHSLTHHHEYLKWASKQRKLKASSGDGLDMDGLGGYNDVTMDGDEDLMSNA